MALPVGGMGGTWRWGQARLRASWRVVPSSVFRAPSSQAFTLAERGDYERNFENFSGTYAALASGKYFFKILMSFFFGLLIMFYLQFPQSRARAFAFKTIFFRTTLSLLLFPFLILVKICFLFSLLRPFSLSDLVCCETFEIFHQVRILSLVFFMFSRDKADNIAQFSQ